MLFLKRVTPPEFSQIRLQIIVEIFGEKEEFHGVTRNCISHDSNESGASSLRQEFCFPTRDFRQNFLFEINESNFFIPMKKEGEPKMLGLGRDLAKIENILNGGNRGGSAIFAEKDGGFGEVDLLARPFREFFKAVKDGRSVVSLCSSKNHEVISKKEMRNGRAISGDFDSMKGTSSLLFVD